jgi:hypothetical protein
MPLHQKTKGRLIARGEKTVQQLSIAPFVLVEGGHELLDVPHRADE